MNEGQDRNRQTKKRPNIIIFNPDQWRGKDAGIFGNPVVRTPHLDSLAAEGTAFSNCFTQNPVCTPSRCSFFSGWYPHVRGHRTMHHFLQREEPFLLRELKENGYYVWWGGKSDVIPREDESGAANERFKIQPGTFHKRSVSDVQPGHKMFYAHYLGKIDEHNPVQKDDLIVEGAIEFLRSNPPEPFALVLTLSSPHCPFEVEEPYYSMYDRSKLPPIIPEPAPGTKTELLSRIRERMELDRLTDEDFKEILAVYYGMITRTDANLGKLTGALKETGLWDDTAVFMFSDHGEYAGDYRMVEKTQNTFEDSLVKVPLVVKYPSWVPVPKRDQPVDALVELVDFYATVKDLAELPNTHTHFGKSLVPLSLGETDTHRSYVFCEGGALSDEIHTHETNLLPREEFYWPRASVQNDYPELHGKAVMIRDREWKYVKRLYERSELYHLAEDPDELVNLSGDPEYIKAERRMERELLNWFLATGDIVPYRMDERWPGEEGIKFDFNAPRR